MQMVYCDGCGKYRVKELMLKDLSGCYVCEEKDYKKENPDFHMLPESRLLGRDWYVER